MVSGTCYDSRETRHTSSPLNRIRMTISPLAPSAPPAALAAYWRDHVRGRLTLEAVYAGVELRGSGRQRRAACPLHGGDRASLSVNAETLAWRCHQEAAGGDALDWIAVRARFVAAAFVLASRSSDARPERGQTAGMRTDSPQGASQAPGLGRGRREAESASGSSGSEMKTRAGIA